MRVTRDRIHRKTRDVCAGRGQTILMKFSVIDQHNERDSVKLQFKIQARTCGDEVRGPSARAEARKASLQNQPAQKGERERSPRRGRKNSAHGHRLRRGKLRPWDSRPAREQGTGGAKEKQ